MGQNSSTTMFETDKVIQKKTTSSIAAKGGWKKLLNQGEGGALSFSHMASLLVLVLLNCHINILRLKI